MQELPEYYTDKERKNMELEMSKSKHTPGPWIIRGKRYIDSPNRGKKYQAICQVGSYGVRISKIDEANARLIAAAPDLLETCKYAMDCIDLDGSLAKEIKAAIAKAEKG